MGNKVICQSCLNQTNGFCSFKKSKVKLKKKRVCDKFKLDSSKVKTKTEIPTTKRPDWFWDREQRRKLYKEELRKLQERIERDEIQTVNPVRDAKHPLTGDLSRFTTTATKEKK